MLKTLGMLAIGILAMATLSPPSIAAGAVYKWKDASGGLHFTQTPPPPGATLLDGPKVDAPRPVPKGEAAPKATESGPTGAARGLTWGTIDAVALPSGTVNVGCIGGPALADPRWAHRGNCNPYHGDTTCSASLPMLCYSPDGSQPPPGVVKTGFHEGWAEGSVATTVPVRGSALSSRQAADELCRSALGNGWRMAEFHDGSGGWGFTANGRVNAGSRFWVYINDQPGNCWDPQPAASPSLQQGASPPARPPR